MEEREHHRNKLTQISEFLRVLSSVVDDIRKKQLQVLYDKFKRKGITTEEFYRLVKDVAGGPSVELAICKMRQLGKEKTVVKAPGYLSHNGVSPISAGIDAKKFDARGVQVNQLNFKSSETLSSSATVQGLNKNPQQHIQLPSSSGSSATSVGGPTVNMTIVPKFERLTSANDPSRVQDSSSLRVLPPVQALARQSSEMIFSPSATNASFVSSSVTTVLDSSTMGKMGIKPPGLPSHNRVSPTSDGIDAQNYDPRGVHVNQLPSTSPGSLSSSATIQGLNKHIQLPSSSGTLGSSGTSVGRPTKSIFNMTTVPTFQRPTSANDPSRVQDALSHLKNCSSSPHLPPVQVLERQSSGKILSTSTTCGNFISASMTTHLDSSTMVNLPLPGPCGTTQAGAIVVSTPNIPFVSRKKPLETLGSSLPPSSKKQKVCSTPSRQSIEQLNDVTTVINLEDEEEQLFSSGPKKDDHVSKAYQRVVHEEEKRTFLQKMPLQRKLTVIMAKSGLKQVSGNVERCLSMCVEERMRGLLSNVIRLSKQRIDVEKSRNRTFVTSDIGKQIYEMNQKLKEEWEKNRPEEKELKDGENDAEKEDNRLNQVKANKEADEKVRANANAAARAAVGGNDAILKWKLMAEARQKPSSELGKNSKKPNAETGGKRFGKNKGAPKVARSISMNDVIAVLETEPQMSKSTLLYRLYNRVCSESVQTEMNKT